MNNYSKLLENNRQEALKIAKEKNLKSLPSSFVATKIIEIPKQGIEYKSVFGPLIEKPIIDIDNIFDDRNPYYYMKKCLQNNSDFQFIPLSFSIDIQTNYNYIDPFYEFAFDANTRESVTKYLFYENVDDINRKINM